MTSLKSHFRQVMWDALKETSQHPDIFRINRLHDTVEETVWNNLWSQIYDQVKECLGESL